MKKTSENLGTEPIKSLLTRLSVPAVIGMVFNALYNLVDTIYVGKFVGAEAIGGLAIIFPIQIMVIGFGIMIGIGAASLVSRNLGAKKIEQADKIAGNAFFLVVTIAISFVIFLNIFLKKILYLFGATPEIFQYSYDYFSIVVFGIQFLIFSVVSNNLIRAEGNAKTAMVSMIIGTGSNLILDPIFIIALDMGIKGAATATIISQFFGFLFVLNYFLRGKSNLNIKLQYLKPKYYIIKEILLVGLPTFARNLAGSILVIIVNNSLKIYGGSLAISVYGILNRLLLFTFMPMFGMVQGFQPVCGYNFGAKQMKRVKETVQISMKRLLIYASVVTGLVMIFPTKLIYLFTSEPEYLKVGTTSIRIMYAIIPLVGIQFLAGSFFQAIGKVKQAFVVSLSRQVLFFIPLVFIIPRFFGLVGVWLTFPIADLLSIIVSYILLKKEMIKFNLS